LFAITVVERVAVGSVKLRRDGVSHCEFPQRPAVNANRSASLQSTTNVPVFCGVT
jgi:hypothetical protein